MFGAIAMMLLTTAELEEPKPTPLEPLFGFSAGDYPQDALRAGEHGQVRFTLDVDAAGLPTNCTITTSSGFPRLDAQTCELLKLRARFTPARDPDGQAVP